MKEKKIGTKLQLKKGHPCGSNEWEVIRLGADVKIKCNKCAHMVMISRIDLDKKIKKIII